MSLNDLVELDRVPSLPVAAVRVIEIAQQSDPDIADLTQAVRADIAMVGRILKFANSALFGLRTRCTTIDAAVPLLGTKLVRTLVLGFSLAQQSRIPGVSGPWFRRLWKETLFQASTAEFLGERVNPAEAPTWFLGGLLRDVGHLAMLNVFQDEYVSKVLESQTSESRVDLEIEHFGYSHVDVSVALCGRWRLDTDFVQAITGHHLSVTDCDVSHVRFSEALAASACCSEYLSTVSSRLDTDRNCVERSLSEFFGVLPFDLSNVLADIGRRSMELAAGFSMEIGDLPPYDQILAKAQSVLFDVAINGQLTAITGRRFTSLGNPMTLNR